MVGWQDRLELHLGRDFQVTVKLIAINHRILNISVLYLFEKIRVRDFWLVFARALASDIAQAQHCKRQD
jgi:hypothetical protein